MKDFDTKRRRVSARRTIRDVEITPALATLAAIIAVVAGIGVLVRSRDGRVRVLSDNAARVDAVDLAVERFAPAGTLVQFSTDMCARCPGVRRLLGELAAESDGVEHVDVDLTNRADLAARYGILQTPTTLIVNERGVVTARIVGVPTPDAVRLHLAALRKDHDVSTSRH